LWELAITSSTGLHEYDVLRTLRCMLGFGENPRLELDVLLVGFVDLFLIGSELGFGASLVATDKLGHVLEDVEGIQLLGYCRHIGVEGGKRARFGRNDLFFCEFR
jgi:hypothetical protein